MTGGHHEEPRIGPQGDLPAGDVPPDGKALRDDDHLVRIGRIPGVDGASEVAENLVLLRRGVLDRGVAEDGFGVDEGPRGQAGNEGGDSEPALAPDFEHRGRYERAVGKGPL